MTGNKVSKRVNADESADLHQLNTVLMRFGMSEQSERDKVRAFCRAQTFAKDELLHRAGELAQNVFFICSGLVRFFYLTEDGKAHNKSFARQNQFAGALQTSIQAEPCRYSIQAIEPTHTLAISLSGLHSLFQQSVAWANLGRLYMESLAVRKTEREAEFLLDSAENRYKAFLKTEPELVERLPLYHIASFLGITDVALSRIRRRMQ